MRALRDGRPGLVIGALLALALAATTIGGVRRASASQSLVGVWKIYPPGWNLVAGPSGSHLAPRGETVLGLDEALAQYADEGSFSARAGQGYWAYYPSGAMLLLIGIAYDVTSVHVDGGHWALLGNSGTKPAVVRGADLALVYDPQAGWATARQVQPGQAAMVYADSDTDAYMDPFTQFVTPYTPLLAQPMPSTPPPALPSVAGETTGTPIEELSYLIALSPLLANVDDQLGNFADNVDVADPANPAAPEWQRLRDDTTSVADDEAALEALPAPARYLDVHQELVGAMRDIADGMYDTVAGLLGGDDQRVSLGSGLLQSGARRLIDAETRLPM